MHSVDKIIIGLGNPEPAYTNTRHNIGAEIVRQMVASFNGTLKVDAALRVAVGRCELEGKKLLCAVPRTYMNVSGEAVHRLLQKEGLALESVLIVFDDLETPFGVPKLTFDGGARGHNGIRSIHARLPKNFFQLRFGIGRPAGGDIAEYVLSRFTDEEMALLSGGAIRRAQETIHTWVLGEV